VHGDLDLGGPVYWGLLVVFYGVGLASLALLLDSLRARRATAFAAGRLGAWVWRVPQAVFFVLFVLTNLPYELGVGALFFAALPFALGQQIAYLLRVVYPSPERLAAWESSAEELLATGEPGPE
jgi:hypothetical protein